MDRPISAKPTLKWPVIAAIGVIVLIAAGVTLLDTDRSVRIDSEQVTIGEVQRGIFRDFVPFSATVVPRDLVYLDAQEGGQVARVLAEAGDYVAKDQVLVEFGNTNLQLQVIERETRLIEQINNLRNVESSLEQLRISNDKTLADIDYEIVRLSRVVDRRNSLALRGATTAEEREQAADELAHYRKLREITVEGRDIQEGVRRRRLPELSASLSKLEQNLAITRGKLDNLIVRAPIAGRLTAFDLKMGQHCEPGQRLAEITADSGFKLSADVDEFYLNRIHKGQTARGEIDKAFVDLSVVRVYPQVKEGRFVVDLEFKSEQAPSGLLPGQTIRGRLQVGEDSEATLIPAGAYLEDTGGRWVFVVDANGAHASKRPISIGRRNTEQVEVVDGLRPGERVITSNYTGWDRFDRIDLSRKD